MYKVYIAASAYTYGSSAKHGLEFQAARQAPQLPCHIMAIRLMIIALCVHAPLSLGVGHEHKACCTQCHELMCILVNIQAEPPAQPLALLPISTNEWRTPICNARPREHSNRIWHVLDSHQHCQCRRVVHWNANGRRAHQQCMEVRTGACCPAQPNASIRA